MSCRKSNLVPDGGNITKKKFTPKNSKHSNIQEVPNPKDPEVEATILYRQTSIVVRSQGFVRMNTNTEIFSELFDENNKLVGSVTSAADKDSYSLSLMVGKSSLTIKFVLGGNRPSLTPLNNQIIATYPTLSRYKEMQNYSIINFNLLYRKDGSNIKSWEVKIGDKTAFSKVAENSKSILQRNLQVASAWDRGLFASQPVKHSEACEGPDGTTVSPDE